VPEDKALRSAIQKPKLLYIIGQLGRGGAEQQLYYLLKYLQPMAIVVSLTSGGYWADPIRQLGIEVVEMKRYGRADLRRLIRLIQLINDFQPDLVHIFTDGPAGLYGRLAALSTRQPRVIVGERRYTAVEPAWYRWLKKYLNRYVTYIICNSLSSYHYILDHRLITSDKVARIPNGIEPDKYLSLSIGRKKSETGPLIVGTIGSLRPVKDPALFLRVVGLVTGHLTETKFIHIGDGPMGSELLASSQRLQLQDKLSYLGHQDDVSRFLNDMDVFVLTSMSEGMSNVVMEAMAAGLPCVVTDAGDNRELVRDGESGFVVPVGDEELMAHRLLLLLNDEEMRKCMGAKGRELTKECNVRRMAAEYEKVYEKVMSPDVS